jgi:hypothetical protein
MNCLSQFSRLCFWFSFKSCSWSKWSYTTRDMVARPLDASLPANTSYGLPWKHMKDSAITFAYIYLTSNEKVGSLLFVAHCLGCKFQFLQSTHSKTAFRGFYSGRGSTCVLIKLGGLFLPRGLSRKGNFLYTAYGPKFTFIYYVPQE